MRVTKVAATTTAMALVMAAVALPVGAASSKAADEQIAAAGALALTDFPAGWRVTPSEQAPLSTFEQFPECRDLVQARSVARQKGARVSSDNFDDGTVLIDNTVYVMPTVIDATRLYDAYSSKRTQQCVAKILQARVEKSLFAARKDAKVTTKVSRVSGPDLGTAATRYRIEIKVTGAGVRQTGHLDHVFVQNDRSVTAYQRETNSTPTDSMLEQLVVTTQQRLTAAFAAQPAQPADALAAPGTTQTSSEGAAITVFSVKSDVPGKFSGVGPFIVADVQICAPKGSGSSVDASPRGFQVVFPDESTARPTFGGPGPELDSKTLRDGACVRGNLSFESLQELPATKFVYDTGFGGTTPLAWQVG